MRWMSWPERSPCLLFENLSYLTALAVSYDWLHCKYLGVDATQLGSILFLLVFTLLPHGDPLQNLKMVWDYMEGYYAAHQVSARYTSFGKLTMFVNVKKKTSPKLRGKGALIKAMGPLLLSMWSEWMDQTCPWHAKIKTMLKLNCSLEKILAEDQSEMALSKERSDMFIKFCFGMCQLHRELAVHFYSGFERALFPDIPKIHPLLHIALSSGSLHPSRTSCWKGEDAMGHHRALARSAATRLKAPRKTEKLVQKMRIAISFQLTKLAFG